MCVCVLGTLFPPLPPLYLHPYPECTNQISLFRCWRWWERPIESQGQLARANRMTRGSGQGDLPYAPQIAYFSAEVISTAFKMGQ